MDRKLPNLVFDFDSTLVSVEAADELFARSLEGRSDGAGLERRFAELTDMGMDGRISYEDSLRERLKLLRATRQQVADAGRALIEKITPSVERARPFLERHRERIWIVSGGFEELIHPVVAVLGLRPAAVRAQRFQWDAEGRIAGADPGTALARGGKQEALRELDLGPPVWVVGDGSTDLELREVGLADRFLAFIENRARSPVVEMADDVLSTMDDLVSPINALD
jgi:D-3-phosphoglycerate dehydrogenase / 2-oxoglutarate reductase